ncbi:hypothetical protein FGB62_332g02 [Gracilaria domingensis]|nr:hypothetical protein FGB62_332g02 [Gracilaria domingensis]
MRVEQTHAILKACRTYLRVFDSESALVSEVFEATRILERSLNKLPLENFPEPQLINQAHFMRVFRNRKDGPLEGMKRIMIPLLSRLHYAAAPLDPYRTPREDIELHTEALRAHLEDYYRGGSVEEVGGVPLDDFITQIIRQYHEVRSLWVRKNIIRSGSESRSGMNSERRAEWEVSPLRHWNNAMIPTPSTKLK